MFVIKELIYKDILNIEKLTINRGEVTSIVGESGAGKTTFLKLLNQMETPNRGEIFYQSKNIQLWNPIEWRRTVSMLSQQPVMIDGTIRENLQIGLMWRDMPPVSDKQLSYYLKIAHLIKSLDEDVNNLSGGEKQRLALARMLLCDPDVYLLDEPTSALDDQTEDLVMNDLLTYLKKLNKTVIMITHSTQMAKRFSDQIIELKKQSS
ncbi:ABC transporter ATP-binding protein [Bacillus kexueae]|uniref:ABC transporter ATP-binding protein n=1 Tax=Aeribacillus kexueae TaxID=2078952 RepID=UPI001FAEC864|nr:ABC transporter ATP-binding protein [Bacillus kexueae]